MTQGRITISRTKRDKVIIFVKDMEFNILFEGEMTLLDYAGIVTGEAELPITIKEINEGV